MTRAAVFAPLKSGGQRIWRGGDGTWLSWAGPCFVEGAPGGAVAGLAMALTEAESEANNDHILAGVDGSFVLALSRPDGSLRVITDRLGTLHAYTTTVDGAAVIATSSAVLGALRDADWNLTSCREFLATGTVFGQRCLFRDIDKLPPASVLTFSGGREVSRSRYWRIEEVTRTYDSKSDPAALASALSSALNQIRRMYPNAVLDLTGGLDSRALLSAALRSSMKFDTVVCGRRDDADVVVAGRIAERFRLRHQHVEPATFDSLDEIRKVLPLCDGEYDVFEYARIAAIHTGLAAQYDASVNGSNGELAKGYWWELLFPFTGSRRFDTDRVAARRFAFMRDPEILDATFDNTLAGHFAQLIRESNRQMRSHANTAIMDNVYLTLRMQHWQGGSQAQRTGSGQRCRRFRSGRAWRLRCRRRRTCVYGTGCRGG
jgi:asparagine synthase (glutamine-hydrolysing)